MINLTYSIAFQTHRPIILEILQETQAWLWEQNINQWTLPFEAKWIAESIEKREFYVVEVQQETAAVFRLTHSDSMWPGATSDAFYIHSLAVQQSWRGHGIGQQILEWIEGHAIYNNKRYLRLDCMAENLVLCRYYEQAGFVEYGVNEIQYDDSASVYKAKLFEKALVLS